MREVLEPLGVAPSETGVFVCTIYPVSVVGYVAAVGGYQASCVYGGGGGILDETHPPDFGPTWTPPPLLQFCGAHFFVCVAAIRAGPTAD